MKITIEGFIVAQQYKWESEPRFTWFAHKPCHELSDIGYDIGYVIVAPHAITLEIPEDFNMSLAQINALEQQKVALKSKFVADVQRIDEQIENLLALPNETKE